MTMEKSVFKKFFVFALNIDKRRDKKSQNFLKNRVLVPTQKSLQMVPTCGQAETVRKVALASRYFERLSKNSNAIVKASLDFV